MNNPTPRSVLLLPILAVLLCQTVQALPEDASQPIHIDGSGGASESYQEEDLLVTILNGSAAAPVIITQGTIKIAGATIKIEGRNEEVVRITATGMPASFQQQLKANEVPVLVLGEEIIVDNASSLLSVNKEAKLEQGGRTTTAYHIEYDLESGRFKTSQGPDGEGFTIVIPPPAAQ